MKSRARLHLYYNCPKKRERQKEKKRNRDCSCSCPLGSPWSPGVPSTSLFKGLVKDGTILVAAVCPPQWPQGNKRKWLLISGSWPVVLSCDLWCLWPTLLFSGGLARGRHSPHQPVPVHPTIILQLHSPLGQPQTGSINCPFSGPRESRSLPQTILTGFNEGHSVHDAVVPLVLLVA